MTGSPSNLHSSGTHASSRSTAEGDPYFSRAVGKAFQLLEILARSTTAVAFTELVREMRLTKSSVFRLLHTLESLHYIERDPQGHYSLAPSPRNAFAMPMLHALLNAAQEPVLDLHARFRETVSVAVLMGNHMEVIHVIDSPHLVRMSNIPGRILPPHASSLGKAITAHQNAAIRKLLLQSYGLNSFTASTLTEERLLEKDYQEIVIRGYAVDAEESTVGGHCMAVPIHSAQGRVEAALSISMPVSRLPAGHQRQTLIDRLRDAGRTVSEALSGKASRSRGQPRKRQN